MMKVKRVVRRRDLRAYDGLGNTQRNKLIAEGKYPRPIKLTPGGRAIGWIEDELVTYQTERLAERDHEVRS